MHVNAQDLNTCNTSYNQTENAGRALISASLFVLHSFIISGIIII